VIAGSIADIAGECDSPLHIDDRDAGKDHQRSVVGGRQA
jgi:hypothetical protein